MHEPAACAACARQQASWQVLLSASVVSGRTVAAIQANTAPAAITLAARKLFFRRLKLWLVEKLTYELPFLFIFNAREKFRSQSRYCLWFIERHLLINLPTRKVAGLALRLKNRFDLSLEVGFYGFRSGKTSRSQD
jgi:hypothetical protein